MMSPAVKLAFGATIIMGVTVYTAYVGASASWKYYMTSDECLADRSALAGRRLRVSGEVAAGTLCVNRTRTRARFAFQGRLGTLEVDCAGALPDNLKEGVEVVVEGQLAASGELRGDQVLARCVSKYEAAESNQAGERSLAAALKEAG